LIGQICIFYSFCSLLPFYFSVRIVFFNTKL